jgi:predicted Zn-dependent peptidase
VVLIVVGDVEPAELFAALAPTMRKMASKAPLPPKPRAWATPAPPLAEERSEEVPFPSEDESTGERAGSVTP